MPGTETGGEVECLRSANVIRSRQVLAIRAGPSNKNKFPR